MKAYTYLGRGKSALTEKPVPHATHPRDAVVKVTLSSICTSDLHILHGAVPRAERGVTLGHEFVGVVEEAGSALSALKKGDRVAVNVETYCGECYFCRHGWVNNCTHSAGGWALGCRIDGGQAEYARIPFADTNLVRIPAHVSDEAALFAGDLLSTGYWAAKIGEIHAGDTVLVIGAGPTGYCTALCARLRGAGRLVLCEKDAFRRSFAKEHFPEAEIVSPEEALPLMRKAARGGADVVIEAAGTPESFRLAWECARPNAVVVIVAMYEEALALPLPAMYGKTLVFKPGGVDGCDMARVMEHIAAGELDAAPLLTRTFPLADIGEAYALFARRPDGVMKVAVKP